MALLEGTQMEYYQGNEFGNYQFISLDDIITQFQIAYVGEGKIISKIKRADIAFHAQRALQELSFDTFKSIKSYQIDIPSTLVMPLPHDYVNYTKISWVDSTGIKHRMYPHACTTNNPFQIRQETDGSYSFPTDYELLANADFSNPLIDTWDVIDAGSYLGNYNSGVGLVGEEVKFSYVSKSNLGAIGWGQVSLIYQAIDVSHLVYITISADGVAEDITYTAASGVGTADGTATSTVRFGLSSSPPDNNVNNNIGSTTMSPTINASTSIFDLTSSDGNGSYVEWTGNESSTKTVETIDVSNVNTVYAIGLSFVIFSSPLVHGQKIQGNSLDNVSVKNNLASTSLQPEIGNEKNSSTWNAYKSGTSNSSGVDNSLNTNPAVDIDNYFDNTGQRYGLDPQYAQANGKFFIDPRLGRIHFSSNVSGKTVILDYISDSLGTDAEMQVHKFAEEAMYKWLAHAILSTRTNIPEYVINRFKKERFAAIRNAKLRLSNIKLEEITQVLRGKSKHIKH